MAPEQAERPRSVDTRSDIYSFGATYYHALTGVPPFLGDSDFAILFKHKTEPLISPRDRCEDVSENIAELLERCLAKSPDERFQSFRDVLAELDENNETSPWLHVDDPALSLYLERLRSHRRTYFSDELQANRTTYFEDWFPVGDVDVFRFPNGRVLRVVAGDITTQPVDAIVSSDDSNLSMSGGVSLAILKAAGERLRDEALIYAPVRPGRAIVTSAGNLGARFVFHSVTMGLRDLNYAEPSKDLIFEILRSCFYHAETLNVKSIAFPLLATGSGGFSKDICLEIMFAYLARVLLRSITPVNEVRIVLYTPGNNVR
jgi:O-acetyl-ADP-ribose deacetylase (regulator of RNase III)